MIKIEVNKGATDVKLEGLMIELLAEVPIGFGRALHGILNHCPEDLKIELIKTTFELTLKSMREADEDESDSD